MLGASRGEGGILGEGVRQAHLRDPTYGPALDAARGSVPGMSVELEIVDDPARACAAMMVGAAAGGGHVVLTGGSTPRAAYEEFVRAVPPSSIVDLAETHFWFGDERCVGPDDERSNFRMAARVAVRPARRPSADPATPHAR